jgi:hypothetical protein
MRRIETWWTPRDWGNEYINGMGWNMWRITDRRSRGIPLWRSQRLPFIYLSCVL